MKKAVQCWYDSGEYSASADYTVTKWTNAMQVPSS